MTAKGPGKKTSRSPLTRRGSKSATGQFNSIRDDEIRIFRGTPHFMHLVALDVQPDVEHFSTEVSPLTLADGWHFLPEAVLQITGSTRPIVQHVTYRNRVEDDPEAARRIAMIVAACDQIGAEFELVLERRWKDPIRWSIASLLRHSARRASPSAVQSVRSVLQEGPLSLAEVLRETGLSHEGRFAALCLCARRHASIRWDRRITDATIVSLR